MASIELYHKFFPVGQGLFATGSLTFRFEDFKRKYFWVYDCGSSSSRRLVTNSIGKLKDDCNQKIDLLAISHFHNDHISGVVELLNEVGAKTVMLPWAPLWHRLLIGFDQGLREDDVEMQFFIDPVQYLAERAEERFERVLFVMPSEGEGPGFSTEPDFEPEPPEVGVPGEPSDLDLPDRQSRPRLRKLESGQSVQVFGVWEFIPYNDPDTRPSDPTNFESTVASHREALLNGDDNERKEALKTLRSLYETTFGPATMNDVSLMLYGGAIGRWQGRWFCRGCRDCRCCRYFGYCRCCRKHEMRASILLTGDGNLSSISKWNILKKYLDPRRAIRTSVFQVPHHGARANWFEGLAAEISPSWSVFSSDPDHSYGHPHAEVLRDFWKYNAIQVDQHSGFSLDTYLSR